jgi:hypothetical protein
MVAVVSGHFELAPTLLLVVPPMVLPELVPEPVPERALELVPTLEPVEASLAEYDDPSKLVEPLLEPLDLLDAVLPQAPVATRTSNAGRIRKVGEVMVHCLRDVALRQPLP